MEMECPAVQHSCGKQADSAQQSKHTAGLEVPPPSASWSPHHASQPVCRQLRPSHLLLSTTFSRKTASHYPEPGVRADGQTPGQSAGSPV
ncbi:hypothetical protein PBY51_010503 [Eleginops maclovinus]|uniref:Uncharacterized protein n=1 Tax=Eleginops maclovinus TaxID=56733 RepID=A0AAN8AC51_ELEMC|nr:hypothetical protein PBY51_010503 [Eleginops maclovinus]